MKKNNATHRRVCAAEVLVEKLGVLVESGGQQKSDESYDFRVERTEFFWGGSRLCETWVWWTAPEHAFAAESNVSSAVELASAWRLDWRDDSVNDNYSLQTAREYFGQPLSLLSSFRRENIRIGVYYCLSPIKIRRDGGRRRARSSRVYFIFGRTVSGGRDFPVLRV